MEELLPGITDFDDVVKSLCSQKIVDLCKYYNYMNYDDFLLESGAGFPGLKNGEFIFDEAPGVFVITLDNGDTVSIQDDELKNSLVYQLDRKGDEYFQYGFHFKVFKNISILSENVISSIDKEKVINKKVDRVEYLVDSEGKGLGFPDSNQIGLVLSFGNYKLAFSLGALNGPLLTPVTVKSGENIDFKNYSLHSL
ncbi:hypothetical protein [Gallaecimonas xiamenensis]|uniref:hypothetical protein n=1 Tax=Gallaecimonas xiamenensis TaxID=1207039 RepID=UPI0012E9AD55|nr:hypothetical protein [Gallaecimonas xiamenensis]